MVSKKLRSTIKLSEQKSYQIAHEAEMSPATLSRIINGIDLVKKNDPRVARIARVVGLPLDECFEEEN